VIRPAAALTLAAVLILGSSATAGASARRPDAAPTLGAAQPPAATTTYRYRGVAFPVQSLNDRGTNVLAIQRLLRARFAEMTPIPPLPPANGRFGSGTANAVKTFQGARGLTATGIVDGATWGKLVPVLSLGSSGEAVQALQAELVAKRHATIALDGVFGPTTRTAVVTFQTHIGRPATGVVDSATWRGLTWHFELPAFTSSSLCDYSVGNGAANWGTAEAIDTLEAVGRAMVAAGYGRIAVGDVSLEHGGDIPGHETHERGLDIDIRMMRRANDQCTWGSRWFYSTYDRAATRAMINAFRAASPGHIKLVYFNDPVLIKEGLTTWFSGHDDHVHVRFCEKVDPLATYDC
jgi:peptidoglycan hydrolase-like protein with peptidoglycan-binding domain